MNKPNIRLYLSILAVLIIVFIVFFIAVDKPFFIHKIYWPVRKFFSAHTHRLLSAGDINTIRPWMTLDYINKVFKLPPDYLKNNLDISGSRYPNISINGYAKKEKIKTAYLVEKIQEAVHNYLSSPN